MDEPSGIKCSSCAEEINYFDGPVRLVGKPQQFPFCWKCWKLLLQMIPNSGDIKTKEISDKEMHIWLEKKGR